MRDGRIMRLSWSHRMLWVGILMLAREQDRDHIEAAPRRGYSPRELAALLTYLDDPQGEDTAKGLAALAAEGLIKTPKRGGPITIPNFAKWQSLKPSAEPAEVLKRVEKYREKQRQALRNALVTRSNALRREESRVEADKTRQEKKSRSRLYAVDKSSKSNNFRPSQPPSGGKQDAAATHISTIIDQIVEAHQREKT